MNNQNDYVNALEGLAKKERIIKKLKCLLALVLILTGFISFRSYKQQQYILSYHNTMINSTQYHLHFAHSSINMIDNLESFDGLKANLVQIATHLESASRYIGHYSIYYSLNSKRQGYGGNSLAFALFSSYSNELIRWANAFSNNDLENIPTMEDIKNMQADIKNMTTEFYVYDNKQAPIAQLDYNGIEELLKTLASETKTEGVKRNLENMFYFK